MISEKVNPAGGGDRRGVREFGTGWFLDSYSHSHESTQVKIDPRLIFLARASARFQLVEAGELDIAEAFGGLGLRIAR